MFFLKSNSIFVLIGGGSGRCLLLMLGLCTLLFSFCPKVNVMTEQYWQTKNGLVAVGDMTPDHLRNVLRQLIREKRILPPYKLKSAMLAEREDIHDCIDIDGCQEY
jgi:hypothetical protein